MKKNSKIKEYMVTGLAISSVGFLSGCGKTDDASINTKSVDSDATLNSNSGDDNTELNDNIQIDNPEYSSLKVSSGCIGCGRCMRFDPEHFSLERGSDQAQVISTENLGSDDLDVAIQQCPARAIVRS